VSGATFMLNAENSEESVGLQFFMQFKVKKSDNGFFYE